MIPPSTRLSVAKTFGQASSWAKWTGKAAGNVVWVVTTTALLVGLPMAIAIEDETRLVAQEKEMLGQQQGQAGVCLPSLAFSGVLQRDLWLTKNTLHFAVLADAPSSFGPDLPRPPRLLVSLPSTLQLYPNEKATSPLLLQSMPVCGSG